MKIGHGEDILTPTGGPVKTTSQAVYLGSLLTVSGSSSSSVARRIGEGSSVFGSLCEVWKHANISKAHKMQIYEAWVISKLFFSLERECLRQADKARLNAFHCSCLRKILKVPPSWISRIPNNTVLQKRQSPSIHLKSCSATNLSCLARLQ